MGAPILMMWLAYGASVTRKVLAFVKFLQRRVRSTRVP